MGRRREDGRWDGAWVEEIEAGKKVEEGRARPVGGREGREVVGEKMRRPVLASSFQVGRGSLWRLKVEVSIFRSLAVCLA